jgi:hypothetical protein
MTTEKAFAKLITNLKELDKAGINRASARTWRARLISGTLSLDVMEDALLKAGYKKKPEKWVKKKAAKKLGHEGKLELNKMYNTKCKSCE